MSSFLRLVPSSDIDDSKSVVGIKPDNSGVVIGYQVDEFTPTRSVEHFFAQLHIYSGVNIYFIYFPIEPECEDYSFF